MRGAFSIDERSGERWDLAVELLTRGDGLVSFGPVLLYRDAQGPRADGVLHVEIVASSSRGSLTMSHATRDIARGLERLSDLMTDKRVRDLAETYGMSRKYVDDYDIGRMILATIAGDETVTWIGPPPSAP